MRRGWVLLTLVWVALIGAAALVRTTLVKPQPAPPPVTAVPVAALPSVSTSTDLQALERQMLVWINEERQNPLHRAETKGLAQPLIWDEALAQVARRHCADMLARGYFDHFSPEGLGPADRLTSAGILWTKTGENLAIAPDIRTAHEGFMAEPPLEKNHRGIILSSNFSLVGIGIARGEGNKIYIAQEFQDR